MTIRHYITVLAETVAEADYWTPEKIAHWTSYTSALKFATEQEARDWIFRKLQLSDREPSASLFGIYGPEKNRRIADTMPVFQIGKSFKIGRRTATRRKQWEGIEIRQPSLAPLEAAGWLNPFDGYEVKGIQMLPVKGLHMTEQHSYTEGGSATVHAIAATIKREEWFRAIIVDQEHTILDGHHRYRAVKDVLKWSKIPALVVEIGGRDA